MTKEEITAQADEVKETTSPEETAKEPEGNSTSKENTPDYEALLKAERERREKAEKAAADLAFKGREAKREVHTEVTEEEEERPLTKRELQELLAQERERTTKELQAARIKEIARNLGNSDAETALIVEIHKNRGFPTDMPLEQQLEEAHAIANSKRLVGENSELKRALISKETASRDGAGTQHDGMEGTAPKVAPDMEASLKRTGFAFDNKAKVWKKKLPNGLFLYKDLRKKTSWTGK